ncbi:MAG: oligosaccharide flippase family protein [Terriglobia bacterium]
MKEEIGRLVKHAGIYGAGVILNKSVGFLLIPLYTRFLTPADYGVLELLDLTIFFSGIFCMMGISSAVFRFYAVYDTESDRKEVIASALFFVTIASLLVSVALQLLAVPLAATAFGNIAYAPYVRVVSWTLFFSNLTEVPFAYWRAQHRTVLFVVVNLIRTIVSAGTLIVAVAVLQRGVQGVVYANLITNGILGLLLLGTTLSKVGFRVMSHKLREMLAYGAPLIVQSIASFILVFSDRLFLRHFASLTEVGIYSLGYKLAGIVALLVSGPFTMTWSWHQFEVAKKGNAKDTFAHIQLYQLLVSVFVALVITLLAKDALRIMAPAAYWDASKVVPLIALSYVLGDMRAVIWTGILLRNRTHHLGWISGIVAASNLLLNFVLIPRYSYMGAAVATVLSYALSLTLGFILAQSIYFIRYEYRRNAIVLGSAVAIYLISTQLSLQISLSLVANVFVALLFPVIAIVMLRREERIMLWQLGRQAVERMRNLRLQHES